MPAASVLVLRGAGGALVEWVVQSLAAHGAGASIRPAGRFS